MLIDPFPDGFLHSVQITSLSSMTIKPNKEEKNEDNRITEEEIWTAAEIPIRSEDTPSGSNEHMV